MELGVGPSAAWAGRQPESTQQAVQHPKKPWQGGYPGGVLQIQHLWWWWWQGDGRQLSFIRGAFPRF